MKKKLLFLFAFCLVLSSGSVKSQVTIGSGEPPVAGALLQLKETEVNDGSANAKGGLGMPRVKLSDADKLIPMYSYVGADDTPSALDEQAHTGLIVYHTDQCTMDGSGMYVWDGLQWAKLGKRYLAGLNLSTDKFRFWNGMGNVAQTVGVSWNPTGATYTPPTYVYTGLSFTSSPPSGALANSPETVSFKPNDMTAAEISANPFAKKTGKITFLLQNSPCANGGTQTKSIEVELVNKALMVNGKVKPDQVEYTATTAGATASVQSNAKWKLASITPTVNSAVTSTDTSIKGTELNDNSSETNTISYDVTVGAAKARYNYLTFSDAETPKRFADVVLTVAQCSGENDLTMKQYRDLWQERYGTPGAEDHDRDGAPGKRGSNTNRVQWHYDQDGNIFFSAMFGNERWMITNLAATSYASDSPNKPTLTETYASSITDAYYGYPGGVGTDAVGAADSREYDKRERLGRLYNWAAATGGQNTSTANQLNTNPIPQIQGICPSTWHLPGDAEWTVLMTELSDNPTQYSGNAAGANTAYTAKDMCEPDANTGQSFGVLDGGFNMLLAGDSSSAGGFYGIYGYFWSSSRRDSLNAYSRYLFNLTNVVGQSDVYRSYHFSVRCKKD